MSASIESGVAIFHAVGEEIFFFLKKTLRVSPAYSKEHGRDRDKSTYAVYIECISAERRGRVAAAATADAVQSACYHA